MRDAGAEIRSRGDLTRVGPTPGYRLRVRRGRGHQYHARASRLSRLIRSVPRGEGRLFRSLTQTPGGTPEIVRVVCGGPGLPHLPKTAVLNRDDSSFEYLARIPAERVITYGTEEPLRGSTGAEELESRGAEGALSATALHLLPSASPYACGN